jgi:BirA family biotin operon repressor/biotin-[acetyl-CoA-carboxylase] ligase
MGERVDNFVVYSDVQTQGKGRWGREWWSPEGGLWCSLVLQEVSIPSLRGAFSTVQTIKKFTSLSPRIRWPNDVIVRNKKVGGILTEKEKKKIIIGIGINLNQKFFPLELQEATSLRIETRRSFLVEKFLYELVRDFELNLNNARIIEQIKEVLLFLGEKVSIKVKEGTKIGEFLDIGEDGSLILREDTGIIRELKPSEVKFMRETK